MERAGGCGEHKSMAFAELPKPNFVLVTKGVPANS